ncbi:hypothetical protein OG937_17860 [Streptomyces sp. NBC_00510]
MTPVVAAPAACTAHTLDARDRAPEAQEKGGGPLRNPPARPSTSVTSVTVAGPVLPARAVPSSPALRIGEAARP